MATAGGGRGRGRRPGRSARRACRRRRSTRRCLDPGTCAEGGRARRPRASPADPIGGSPRRVGHRTPTRRRRARRRARAGRACDTSSGCGRVIAGWKRCRRFAARSPCCTGRWRSRPRASPASAIGHHLVAARRRADGCDVGGRAQGSVDRRRVVVDEGRRRRWRACSRPARRLDSTCPAGGSASWASGGATSPIARCARSSPPHRARAPRGRSSAR